MSDQTTTFATAAATLDLVCVMGSLDLAELAQRLPVGSGRRWVLLHRDERCEAWAIAWPVGSGLPMHDHDGSRAALRVLTGELRERFVGPDDEVRVRWLSGQDVLELPADHVHEMVNVGAVEAVSVHVYAPPQRAVRPVEDGPA